MTTNSSAAPGLSTGVVIYDLPGWTVLFQIEVPAITTSMARAVVEHMLMSASALDPRLAGFRLVDVRVRP